MKKQEGEIANLITKTNSYTDTIEHLQKQNNELTEKIEQLQLENVTLSNKLENHQNGLPLTDLLPLLYTLLTTIAKKKIDKAEEIFTLLTDTTSKLTGSDITKDTALQNSFKKLGISDKSKKRHVDLVSTSSRQANLHAINFTASPNNIQN